MEQTVLVTGADKGLGFSLAKHFLRQGFHVFAGEYSGETQLSGLAAQYPGVATIVPLDVAQLASIRRAATLVSGQTPALDILINNAGVHLEDSQWSLEQLDLSDRHLEETMGVNTFGPLRVTQQFLPLLRSGQRKRIINISSEAGSVGDCRREREYAYCMSKAALNMQSKILHNYLHPQGFTVLAVHPGWMKTDMGGPDADIHPDVAAEGIFRLAMKDWQADDGIYVDYLGRPLPW